MTKNRMYWKS